MSLRRDTYSYFILCTCIFYFYKVLIFVAPCLFPVLLHLPHPVLNDINMCVCMCSIFDPLFLMVLEYGSDWPVVAMSRRTKNTEKEDQKLHSTYMCPPYQNYNLLYDHRVSCQYSKNIEIWVHGCMAIPYCFLINEMLFIYAEYNLAL